MGKESFWKLLPVPGSGLCSATTSIGYIADRFTKAWQKKGEARIFKLGLDIDALQCRDGCGHFVKSNSGAGLYVSESTLRICAQC